MTNAVAARNKRNKRKGADWEIDFNQGMREEGFDIERLRLAGKDDEGDNVIREDDGYFLVIENKNAKFEPGVFICEMEREAANFAKHRGLDPAKVDGIVVVKRRGKSWRQAFVLTTVERYFELGGEA
ncbi:hypothetical protein AB0D08_00335 [Kitasatospora sp. NPDC048540]|uniref:hypothetical protein n=1 Tax=Kitasatospora sp. NPDC048540 TaxID=3155634 RepID=UPI003401CF5C